LFVALATFLSPPDRPAEDVSACISPSAAAEMPAAALRKIDKDTA
jgi:hypothetical protein